MNWLVTPLAADWHTSQEPSPLPVLLPDIGPPPSAEAQGGDQEQEGPTEGRSNGNEDRLVPIQPTGEIPTVVGRPYLWWPGRNEIIQEGLVTGGVDTLESNLNKVVMGLGKVVCG